jgi:hypothetical protein
MSYVKHINPAYEASVINTTIYDYIGLFDAIHRQARDPSVSTDSDIDKSDCYEVLGPDEKLTFSEALWIYTVGAATAAGCESFLGMMMMMMMMIMMMFDYINYKRRCQKIYTICFHIDQPERRKYCVELYVNVYLHMHVKAV